MISQRDALPAITGYVSDKTFISVLLSTNVAWHNRCPRNICVIRMVKRSKMVKGKGERRRYV